ncbi:MAG TPA: DUF6794 domain-containing protein [Thermodesulfobacteriota bacterium]|nr:DUF6794 domain-containing protein [Thermodesulfobacteriota bacterium]
MIKFVIKFLTVLFLLAVFGAVGNLTAKAEKSSELEQPVYIPANLDDCFAELKRVLKPEDIEKMKTGAEKEMIQYHFGLGTWIRNNWSLWKESRLTKWFNHKGIYHPDDMSGIIIISFWRHLNSKPIGFDEQVKFYQDYWKEVLERENQEKEREKRSILQIQKMMMGATFVSNQVPVIKMPLRKDYELRARYLATFRDGVLLAIREGSSGDFKTPPYFLDLNKKTIHPIRLPEIQELHSTVVVKGIAYFSGANRNTPSLVAVDRDSRSLIALPVRNAFPQMGTDSEKLLAVYKDSIYLLEDKKWKEIYRDKIQLPKSGPPPYKNGNMIYFHDEGKDENEKRLWWLELSREPRLLSLDQDVGVVGPGGPRWENSFSYCVTGDGDIWATLGEGYSKKSLIKRSVNGEYRLAIINNSVLFDGTLFGKKDKEDGLSISAVSIGKNGSLLAAGDRGLYKIQGTRITQLLAFENTTQKIPLNDGKNFYHWSWDPSNILELGKDQYLITGTFGGIYLIERNGSGVYSMFSIDEALGEAISF